MKPKFTVYHLFLAIPVLYALSLVIFPLVYSVAISFTNWKLGIPTYEFVGLRNYIDEFQDYRFWNSLQVTFLITAGAVPAEIILGLIIAALMSHQIKLRGFFRSILLIPLFTSPVAIALMGEVVMYEAGGPINGYLKLLGLQPVSWRSSATMAPWTVVIWDVWEWTPFCFLIFLAGIQAIPRVYYEAAEIDGASGFQIFKSITLPMLKYPLITVAMFRLVDTLKIFEIPFVLMAGGGPGIATEVQSVYIYKAGFRGFQFGAASAYSMVFLIIVMVIMMIFIRRVRSYYA